MRFAARYLKLGVALLVVASAIGESAALNACTRSLALIESVFVRMPLPRREKKPAFKVYLPVPMPSTLGGPHR